MLILITSASLTAAPETILKTDRTAHVLVLKEVYLNSRGPFRMMIDTGAASSMVSQEVAKKAGLRYAYAVEQQTASGVRRVGAAVVETLTVGPVSDTGVEVLIGQSGMAGVDGILGQSWLVRHDYLLDYHHRRLVLDPVQPDHGVKAALRYDDGRPKIVAEVDGLRQELVVDSGASTLVLFGGRGSIARTTLVTNNGAVDAATGSAKVRIGGVYSRRMTTAQIAEPGQAGLLPAAEFASVYISNRDGVVVLVP